MYDYIIKSTSYDDKVLSSNNKVSSSYNKVSSFNVKVSAYNNEVSSYNDKVSSYNDQVSSCKAVMAFHTKCRHRKLNDGNVDPHSILVRLVKKKLNLNTQ